MDVIQLSRVLDIFSSNIENSEFCRFYFVLMMLTSYCSFLLFIM